MLTIKEYKRAESLKEAWELNQKKNNCILGGMLWMKMGKKRIQTAIDLSGLGLDQIEETPEEFSIGCMTTLRRLEQHPGLAAYTGGAMKEALRHIVGVQFRNLATAGGSIYGRYGFSDVLTMFLAMDSEVELYQGGRMPLREFAAQKPDRDVLVCIHVKKTPASFSYQSVRNTQTDFPVLTCAAARIGEKGQEEYRISIGARPGRAVLVEDAEQILAGRMTGDAAYSFEGEITKEMAEAFGAYTKAHVPTGSNMRGSAAYRSHLAEVLSVRAVQKLGGIELCR